VAHNSEVKKSLLNFDDIQIGSIVKTFFHPEGLMASGGPAPQALDRWLRYGFLPSLKNQRPKTSGQQKHIAKERPSPEKFRVC
jgi:hypothetical protein